MKAHQGALATSEPIQKLLAGLHSSEFVNYNQIMLLYELQ